MTDDLLAALERQKAAPCVKDEVITLVYQENQFEEKLAEAKTLRKQGKKTALVPEGDNSHE